MISPERANAKTMLQLRQRCEVAEKKITELTRLVVAGERLRKDLKDTEKELELCMDILIKEVGETRADQLVGELRNK